jgi:protease II
LDQGTGQYRRTHSIQCYSLPWTHSVFIRDGVGTTIQTYDFDAKKGFGPKAKLIKIKLSDPSHSVSHAQLLDFKDSVLIFRYSILIKPTIKYSYDMATNALKGIYSDNISGYDSVQYITKVIYTKDNKGSNGKRPNIPITIAYKKIC